MEDVLWSVSFWFDLIVGKNDEMWINNDGFCIKNELCIENDDLLFKMMDIFADLFFVADVVMNFRCFCTGTMIMCTNTAGISTENDEFY